MVVYGNPASGASPVVSDLTTGNVNLAVTFAKAVPSAMTVSISGYTIRSIFATTPLTNKPQITYTYQGIYSP
jgi:hypothetical protein